MISIKIKKGCQINIDGSPLPDMETLPKPSHVAILPEKIPFIKLRLLIEPGEKVKIGSVLFEDKQNPDIKFLSPGSGEVVQINFGPRRVIREIVIQLDDVEEYIEFDMISEKELAHIKQEKLVRTILNGGLWQLIKELPFRNIAQPDQIPPAIFVSLGAEEPFQPAPEVYLKEKETLFRYGIQVLQRLSPHLYVFAFHKNRELIKEFDDILTHTYQGKYPADDPGVLLYHLKSDSLENRSWYIQGQDVLLLAHLLKTGRYPIERTVIVAGSAAKERKHIQTRIGVPLAALAQNFSESYQNTRYIVGGIFRGYTASKADYLGFYETALNLIPEGKEKEFFGFARPGIRKPSYSRAFLSVLNRSAKIANCNLHGDERACVNCGTCAKVCPVDMLPQFTFKAILADEVEESLAHGMLDCVECGLCTYVCPSKIEIQNIIRNAKAVYYKELIS